MLFEGTYPSDLLPPSGPHTSLSTASWGLKLMGSISCSNHHMKGLYQVFLPMHEISTFTKGLARVSLALPRYQLRATRHLQGKDLHQTLNLLTL